MEIPRSIRYSAAVAVLILSVHACGDDDESPDSGDPPGTEDAVTETTTSAARGDRSGTTEVEPLESEAPPAPSRDDASTCPFATTDDVLRLTGVEDLTLQQVLFPGDESQGYEVYSTSCSWSDGERWSVISTVHRDHDLPTPVADQIAAMRDELADGADPVRDVSGPWQHGFQVDFSVGSSVFAHGGTVGIEAHIVGGSGADALPLARHVWDHL